MLRATLDQMRSSAGRLAAAGIAILLGTAFVTASLLASATMEQATHDAFTARYADSDLVVTGSNSPLTWDAVDDLRATDGVAAVDVHDWFGMELAGGGATEFVTIEPTPSDPRLAVGTLSEGREATAPGEVVLTEGLAERLGVGIGDDVHANQELFDPETEGVVATSERLEVVGLLVTTDDFFAMGGGGAQVSADQLREWMTAQDTDIYGELFVALTDGADVAEMRAEIAGLPALANAAIQTVPEIAAERTSMETGSQVTFLVITLAFAAVALAVAGLVITNTFQVLVAQRTRTLALLRCVGASRGQIRRSVLLEAGLLGLIASLVGLAAGTGIVLLGVRILSSMYPSAPLDGGVPFGWYVPVVAVGAGVVVTLLAALVPARMATRVAPVAALRPVEGASEARAGRRRLALAITSGVLGAAMLAGGVALALSLSETDASDAGILGGLALGIVGGLLSLTGILVGSVFLVPRLLPLLGRLAGKGVPARIATANAVRNPRRTAATTNALVIGVALVVMMSAGALSARQTLLGELDDSFPVDVAASVADREGQLAPEQVAAVAETEGVAAVMTLRRSEVQIEASGATTTVDLMSVAEGDPGEVLRSDALQALDEDVIVLGDQYSIVIEDGDTVTLTGDSGTVELRVVLGDVGPYTGVVTPATQQALSPDAPIAVVWAQLGDDVDPVAVSSDVQRALNDVATADPDASVLSVEGAAVERAAYGQVIDTLLAVVLGLLAVAVIIALVGVANTLSLSVLERRRENATLRAMGLTRSQLRGMLAVEGVLIAAVGALVGSVAGLLYGWAGAAIVLGGFGQIDLGLPWEQLLMVAVVAVAAGLLASVLPAHSAVRQSPVAALATD